MLPYGKQSLEQTDFDAVLKTLQSDWLTTGPSVAEFEDAFAEYVGAKFAVAVNSATAALHLAMRVANIGAGDRVITSPNTFLASANSAAFVGAVPDFVDIDPVSYNLCPSNLKQGWQDDTAAVVAVDYAGQTAELPAIAEVARQHGAIVIEDACHAIGGQFFHEQKKWRVGGHPWADITTFSFHPVKTMTTGEGGMLVTDNEDFANRAARLRSHGMVRSGDIESGSADFSGLGDSQFQERGPWYYEMQELGYNYRITDFQCALGLSQLKRLDQFVKRRREIVARYNSAFADHPLIQIPGLRNSADRDLTSWHLYTLQFDFEAMKFSRTELMHELRQKGVGTQVLYIPVYLQPWYRKQFGYVAGKCPVAESFYQRSLSIPLFPAMTDDDVEHVIASVKSFLG